jgi:hypothetical protein
MPSGWFRVATSVDVPAGSVRVCEINGQEVVAFRDRGGKAAVLGLLVCVCRGYE